MLYRALPFYSYDVIVQSVINLSAKVLGVFMLSFITYALCKNALDTYAGKQLSQVATDV